MKGEGGGDLPVQTPHYTFSSTKTTANRNVKLYDCLSADTVNKGFSVFYTMKCVFLQQNASKYVWLHLGPLGAHSVPHAT